MSVVRTSLATLLAVVALTLAPAAPAHAAEPVLVLDGHGFGHGVGLAQDGAFWMGRSGSSTDQILGHFYPGASTGRAGGAVRVAILDVGGGETTLSFPDGGEVRSPRSGAQQPGFPVPVPPGGEVRIRNDGRYRVVAPAPPSPPRVQATRAQIVLPVPTSTSTTLLPHRPTPTSPPAPSPAPTTTTTTTAPASPPPPPATVERTSDRSVWAAPANGGTIGVSARGARYRGDIEATGGTSRLRLVNELDVEQYLRGMGEVRDPSWPAASLQSQAIAARTYALRAMRAAGEICDTQRCQVYLGQQAEYRAMDAAVAATAGRVLTFGGGLAAAVYSANGAGISATPTEGFGTDDNAYPYLRAAAYETQALEPWTARVSLVDVARRLRYPGTITDVRVAQTGASGRPLVVDIDGSSGVRSYPGIDVTNALSLRSTKWTPRIEVGEAMPLPAEGEGVQALPDQTPKPEAADRRSPRRAATVRPDESPSELPWTEGVLALLGVGAVAAVVVVERNGAPRTRTSPPRRAGSWPSFLPRRRD